MIYDRKELERRGWSWFPPYWHHEAADIHAVPASDVHDYEAYAVFRVRAALEEAAKRADNWKTCNSQIGPLFDAGVMQGATWIAEAIRALADAERRLT